MEKSVKKIIRVTKKSLCDVNMIQNSLFDKALKNLSAGYGK